MNPLVDAFLQQSTPWRAEMARLREDFKWGKPCYATEQGNVAIIQPFKPHCAA